VKFELYEEDLNNLEVLAGKLMQLSSIVYSRHYYASEREKQDLISVGTLKAYSLVTAGGWDKNRGPLLTYLYSGVRNEMHNYLYRGSREVCYGDFYEDSKDDDYFESELLNIDTKVIEDVCSGFKGYGNIVDSVIRGLREMGFTIVGGATKGKQEEGTGRFDMEFMDDFISRMCGAVLWKRMEYSH
jgi:hypothetical protein